MSPRTGRRSGGADTRQVILAAARTAFASVGYDSTSMREIARRANVDPALVVHYFGSKDRLFSALVRLPDDLSHQVAALAAGDRAHRGESLARFFLALWEAPQTRESVLALVRSAVSHPQAADALRGFITDALLGPLAAALDLPNPKLRAALAGSQLVGVAMVRYVVQVEPLASIDVDTVACWIAPTLQRYLSA